MAVTELLAGGPKLDRRRLPEVRARIAAGVRAYHARRESGILPGRPTPQQIADDPTVIRPDETILQWLRRTAELSSKWTNYLDDVQRAYQHFAQKRQQLFIEWAESIERDPRRLREIRRDLYHRCRQQLQHLRVPRLEAEEIARAVARGS